MTAEARIVLADDSPVSRDGRFAFGANWQRFFELVSDETVTVAERSLRDALAVENLSGKSFLDVGSGSGLFSLAALRLGAQVRSFDYDPQSVACSDEMKARFAASSAAWTNGPGSVLDTAFLDGLGTFDIVYSWGVLHHTGDMWRALANVERLVKPGGRLIIAIYNAQPFGTPYWRLVKRLYNRAPVLRPILIGMHILYPLIPSLAARWLGGRAQERGMAPYRDLIDWLGGYPFEVARPEEIFAFYRLRGFRLDRLKTAGGRHGCNEFTFTREAALPGSPLSGQ